MVYQETVVPKVRLVTKVIVPSYPCPIWVEKERKEPKEIKELGEKTQVRLMVNSRTSLIALVALGLAFL